MASGVVVSQVRHLVFLLLGYGAWCLCFSASGVFASRVWRLVFCVFLEYDVWCFVFVSNMVSGVLCCCSSMASGASVFVHEYGVRCFRFSRMAPSNMASGGRCFFVFRVRCSVPCLFIEYGVRCPVLLFECGVRCPVVFL